MLVIQRRDNNVWAFPGGLVEANGETKITALKREFMEEALNQEFDNGSL